MHVQNIISLASFLGLDRNGDAKKKVTAHKAIWLGKVATGAVNLALKGSVTTLRCSMLIYMLYVKKKKKNMLLSSRSGPYNGTGFCLTPLQHRQLGPHFGVSNILVAFYECANVDMMYVPTFNSLELGLWSNTARNLRGWFKTLSSKFTPVHEWPIIHTGGDVWQRRKDDAKRLTRGRTCD